MRPAVTAALLVLLLPASLLGQELLKLKPLSPVASWRLSPNIGVPEDSLRMVGRGVWIHDIQLGSGEPVKQGDSLSIHFVGFLADARIFSATDRKPFGFTLGSGRVIDGWEDGILGMKVGGRRQLLIPPHLGYGAIGDGAIPPDAFLVFDVTLVDARKP